MGSKEDRGRGFQLVGDPEEPASAAPPESMTFGAFVLSLSTSAAVHLGLVPSAEGGEAPAPNLELARQTIDILEMLEAKTQGNLEADEAKLLEGILYELRMHFVEAGKKKPAPDSGEETGS